MNRNITHAAALGALAAALALPPGPAGAAASKGWVKSTARSIVLSYLAPAASEITALQNLMATQAIEQGVRGQLDELRRYHELAQRGLSRSHRSQAIEAIRELARIVQGGQALAYSNADIATAFREQYRTFEEHLARLRGRRHADLAQRFRDWAETNQDSILGALRAANLQGLQFEDEAKTMRMVEDKMQQSEGQRQLLQAASEIAAMQVGQLQKLRQLSASSIQLQAAFLGGQADRRIEKDAAIRRAMGSDENPFDPNIPPATRWWMER